MSDRIDHEAKAREILAEYGSFNEPHGLAQVHATLALVEQQRIANLIALSNSHDSTLMGIGFDALVEFLPAEGFSAPEPRVHLSIRKGLGL